MSGPVNVPFSPTKRAIAIAIQSAAGTLATMTSADLLDATFSYKVNARTAEDPRYTGTIHKSGKIFIGATYDLTLEWFMHGWGSGTIPALDAFIPGRLLRSLGFSEVRVASAIGPEAFSSGTTTGLTLGTTAVGTSQLYKGYAVNVDAIAAAPGGLAMIQNYTSGKVATLARTRSGAPATGNYTIPIQMVYPYSATEPEFPTSFAVWNGDNSGSGHRLNFRDMRPSGQARIDLFTASREGGDGTFSKISATFTGTLDSEADEACPAVSTPIALPPFLNGQFDVANTQLGGASMAIDFNPQSAFPPNPNQLDGSDPGFMSSTERMANYSLNKVRRSVIDFRSLANAQSSHPTQALFGLSSGNYIGLMVDAQRFNVPDDSENGAYMATNGEAWIDGSDKAVSLAFIKY